MNADVVCDDRIHDCGTDGTHSGDRVPGQGAQGAPDQLRGARPNQSQNNGSRVRFVPEAGGLPLISRRQRLRRSGVKGRRGGVCVVKE
eukprot:1859077-Rhodomonas_salina.1